MKNIFRRLFRKKKPYQPPLPAPAYGSPAIFNNLSKTSDRIAAMNYDPDITIYGPPPVNSFTGRIAGKLIVLTGPDKEKSFLLSGIETFEGITVTVGRYTDTWRNYLTPDQQNSHILIEDPSRSFSKKQFEITCKQGETYLKSLSDKNHTIVDGDILQQNQSVKIRSGSLITAGHIELQYEG